MSDSRLAFSYYTMVEVTNSDYHTSLLFYGINYGCEC